MPRNPVPSTSVAGNSGQQRAHSAAPVVRAPSQSIRAIRNTVKAPEGHYMGTIRKGIGAGHYTVDYTLPGENHTRQIHWTGVKDDALLGDVRAVLGLLQQLEAAKPASPLRQAWSRIHNGGEVPILFEYAKARGIVNVQARFDISADLKREAMTQNRERLSFVAGKQIIGAMEGVKGGEVPYRLEWQASRLFRRWRRGAAVVLQSSHYATARRRGPCTHGPDRHSSSDGNFPRELPLRPRRRQGPHTPAIPIEPLRHVFIADERARYHTVRTSSTENLRDSRGTFQPKTDLEHVCRYRSAGR